MVSLGLGVNLETEILQFPLVVDFLICGTFAAAASQNKYGACPNVDEMEKAVRTGGKAALMDCLEEAI
eukprot:gene1659-49103_t